MLIPRSRFTATACLLSTATGLFCGMAANLFAETPAKEVPAQSDVLQSLEAEYRRDGKQPPASFKQQVENTRRQKKRELERERHSKDEASREATRAQVGVFQRPAGAEKELPVQTVGRSRRRNQDYDYQQQPQQQQPQQAQTPAAGTKAASAAPANGQPAANNAPPQFNRKLTKRERREQYRQYQAEQERLYQQQQAATQKGQPQKVQTAQAQPQAASTEAQEAPAEQVPGPLEDTSKSTLPPPPLPQLPFTTPPAGTPETAANPTPLLSETPAPQPAQIPGPQPAATPIPQPAATPAPLRAATPQPTASVPLLNENETEQETPAPRASSSTRVSAEPQIIESDKPYNRNRPYTPPTSAVSAPPTPAPRSLPAVTRKAAVEVPLLPQTADTTPPANRSAEPSPYSGLKLTPDDAEQRVARALGGPTEDAVPPTNNHELNKAPAVPDLHEVNSADSQQGPEIPGVRGYCLVYLREHRQYSAGLPQYRSMYHNHAYTFSTVEAKHEFDKHPERYAPVQDGTDIVAATNGSPVGGSLDHAAWFKGRLYLFSSAENMAAFWKSPKSYVK